jgi:hypothetical protein
MSGTSTGPGPRSAPTRRRWDAEELDRSVAERNSTQAESGHESAPGSACVHRTGR